MLLDQGKAQDSKSLFEAIGEGDIQAVVSHFTLHAIETMIRSDEKVSEFLRDVEASKGLQVYDTTLADERSIAILAGKTKLDFDDAMQFYVAKQTNSSSIVSFDGHLDRCGVPRREPSQILKQMVTKKPAKTSDDK
ncbi:MAG: type II toxin-antitoxin system VapC family toxin [Nitrososphaerales archaeon]